MRAKLTPAFVAKAATYLERLIFWDEAMPGFGLMVTRNGHKFYVVDYRAAGRKRRMHLKTGLTLTDARREAKAILGTVAKGGDPLGERRKAKSGTLKAIVEEYLAREGDRLRTIDERRTVLERLVLPKLGARPINDITRTDIVRLLDKIGDENGAPMADHVLADRPGDGPYQSQAAAPAAGPVGRRIEGRVAGRRRDAECVFLPCAVPVAHGDKT
jgi:hypothetical protein